MHGSALACDDKSALHQIFIATYIQLTEPQADFILAAKNIITQLEGHQDEQDVEVLSWEALSNVKADDLVKKH